MTSIRVVEIGEVIEMVIEIAEMGVDAGRGAVKKNSRSLHPLTLADGMAVDSTIGRRAAGR